MRLSILGICLCLTLAACDRAQKPSDNLKVPAPTTPRAVYPENTPPGSVVTFEYEQDGGHRIVNEQAGGTGAGLTTSGDEVAAKFAASAPSANLPGIGSSGGDAASEFSVKTIQGAASNPLLWVGILSILGAGVAFYFGLRRAALVCGAIGGGFIAAAMLPGWGWFVLAGAGLVGVAVYIWAEKSGRNATEALRAVVAGVEDLPTEIRRDVKAHVASHADDRDAMTIRAVKRKDGLPSERPNT